MVSKGMVLILLVPPAYFDPSEKEFQPPEDKAISYGALITTINTVSPVVK